MTERTSRALSLVSKTTVASVTKVWNREDMRSSATAPSNLGHEIEKSHVPVVCLVAKIFFFLFCISFLNIKFSIFIQLVYIHECT